MGSHRRLIGTQNKESIIRIERAVFAVLLHHSGLVKKAMSTCNNILDGKDDLDPDLVKIWKKNILKWRLKFIKLGRLQHDWQINMEGSRDEAHEWLGTLVGNSAQLHSLCGLKGVDYDKLDLKATVT